MEKTNKTMRAVIAAVLILVAGGLFWYIWADSNRANDDRAERSQQVVRELVTEFGNRMSETSLVVPPSQAQERIREQYADLVAPEVLLAWQEDTASAPGRQMSGPQPERLEILDVIPLEADAYQVNARVLLTAGGEGAGEEDAGTQNVRIIVERRGGVWLISDYTPVNDFSEPELDPNDPRG